LATGWNAVVLLLDPPDIVTGETVIVPTVVLALVTGTLAEVPPRSDWAVTKLFDESSNPEDTVIGGFAAPVVVKKSAPRPKGLARTKPDGPNDTVCVALPKLGALAVYVAVPLFASAWTKKFNV